MAMFVLSQDATHYTLRLYSGDDSPALIGDETGMVFKVIIPNHKWDGVPWSEALWAISKFIDGKDLSSTMDAMSNEAPQLLASLLGYSSWLELIHDRSPKFDEAVSTMKLLIGENGFAIYKILLARASSQ